MGVQSLINNPKDGCDSCPKEKDDWKIHKIHYYDSQGFLIAVED